MAAVSGKTARIRVGSGPTTFKAKKWDADVKSEALDTTNFESGGFGEYIGGVFDMDVVIECDYDNGNGPMAVLVPGSVISTVKLYINGTAGVYFDCPSLFVERFRVGAEVRGLVNCTIQGKTSGTFTLPLS